MTNTVPKVLNANTKPDYELISQFDENSIYDVYAKVSKELLVYRNIELGVLQAFSYCLYELADNVLNHSGESVGELKVRYFDNYCRLEVFIVDHGIGILKSLQNADKYKNVTEEEALRLCIEDGVTDGKGRGFGLFSTSLLVKHTAGYLRIQSGNYSLFYSKAETYVSKSEHFQGTCVSLCLKTDILLPANKILADRADGENEFNESFLDVSPFDKLW